MTDKRYVARRIACYHFNSTNKKEALRLPLKLGGGEIRTHGAVAHTTVFKTVPCLFLNCPKYLFH